MNRSSVSTFYYVFLLVVCLGIFQKGKVAADDQNQNSCLAYTKCALPAQVPASRIIVAIFSFDFNKMGTGAFLSDMCQKVRSASSCKSLLGKCRSENWPQARYVDDFDINLASWVCATKQNFVNYRSCWTDPFRSRMVKCTGLVEMLKPVDCLTKEINQLSRCTPEARDFFVELLNIAKSLK